MSGAALGALLGTMPVLYLGLSYVFWRISVKLLPGLDASTRTAVCMYVHMYVCMYVCIYVHTLMTTYEDYVPS